MRRDACEVFGMLNALEAVDHETLPSKREAREALIGLNARADQVGAIPIDKALVLYGAGELGKLARHHLATVGIPVECVVDRHAHAFRDDPEWAGYRLMTPDEVDPALKDRALLAISIVTTRFTSLQSTLLSDGWRHCVPFYDVAERYRTVHPLSNGWHARALSSAELKACCDILDGLEDDRSRAHYLRFAAWRLCREEWDYRDAPVSTLERYFISEVASALGEEERVFDVGSHHGSYLTGLLNATGSLSFAWAVEPDPDNAAILRERIARLPNPIQQRIHCYDCVIGDRSEMARFHAGLGYASQVAPTGQNLIGARTIDSFEADPTIIKLHIEGAELNALIGARRTIEKHRPIILATVYHSLDGLTKTPLWLMRELTGYRVILRQHNWCGTGVVLYGIPSERV